MAYADALLSLAEAQRAINQAGASNVRVDDVNDALWAASEEINNYLGRTIIEGSWIEYHRVSRTEPTTLRVLHWPIASVSEIAEDSDRTYGSSSLLTADTDYQIIHEEYDTKIVRISGSVPTTWESGFEAIRITFTGGWTIANVPYTIRAVCSEYLARLYHARANQEHAFETIDNAMGTVKHFGPVMLTRPMLVKLSNFADHGATTCTRWTTS